METGRPVRSLPVTSRAQVEAGRLRGQRAWQISVAARAVRAGVEGQPGW